MDLAEAESELVSGFMTEHAASIFVFFFLAEYASILLMSILTTILFLGGYSCPITPFIILENILNVILSLIWYLYFAWLLLEHLIIVMVNWLLDIELVVSTLHDPFNIKLVESFTDMMAIPVFAGGFAGIVLGIKTCIIVFTFIWVRASFPRIRYDQLMTFCWTVLLPILFAFIILVPCVLYSFDAIPVNFSLL